MIEDEQNYVKRENCLPVCHCPARGRRAACRLAILGWQGRGSLTVTVIHCSGPRQSGCGASSGANNVKERISPDYSADGVGADWMGRQRRGSTLLGADSGLSAPRQSGTCPSATRPGEDSVFTAIPGEGGRHRPKPGFPRDRHQRSLSLVGPGSLARRRSTRAGHAPVSRKRDQLPCAALALSRSTGAGLIGAAIPGHRTNPVQKTGPSGQTPP